MKTVYIKHIALVLVIFLVNTISSYALPPAVAGATVIKGIVKGAGAPLPYVSVLVKGTTMGVVTSENGEFTLNNIPEGTATISINAIGFTPANKEINVVAGKSSTVNFDLKEDKVGLDQIVVTADRNQRNRKEAMTIVNTISPKLMERSNSITLSEGLNFSTGLRMEDNCQNCGFSQVRMNGLEGPYSQILINSRPVFSGLAGVYGLELIPATMIERVEVVRGGGSALYGSNAIAGTINLITKDPMFNSWSADFDYTSAGQTGTGGKPSNDYSANFNTSLVSKDYTTGMSVFGFYRNRTPYDANGDDYSELVDIENWTLGAKVYRKLGFRSKLTLDYFHIDEDRRGGNDFELAPHMADIAEAVSHKINTGSLTYDQFLGKEDKLSIYGSLQHVYRDSYYGAGEDPAGYGTTKDLTFAVGSQFNHHFEHLLISHADLTTGAEYTQDDLLDKKNPYTDREGVDQPETTITDQTLRTIGVYFQQEWSMEKFKFGVGLRYDHYQVVDPITRDSDLKGNVWSPRVNAMYNFLPNLQLRASYSQGYRAPQVFDEDLHIEASTARKVIHRNADNLTQENSRSWSSSLTWTPKTDKLQMEFTAEGFITKLNNPFVINYGAPDENGVVIYTRENSPDGAIVQGINFEGNLAMSDIFQIQLGYTIQSSKYKVPQEDFNERKFYRTPNNYGFLTANYSPIRKMDISLSGTYTGTMLVPYFGTEAPVDDSGEILGELRTGKQFFDMGAKVAYDFTLRKGITIKANCGIKNIFNSYQKDFDKGAERDPAYIYGPSLPRSIYCGIQIGNIL